MSASMAEVLAKHQWYDASSDQEDPAIGCIGCDDWFGSEDALDDGTFAAHQAEQLAANGYGKLEACARPHMVKAPVDGHCWPGEITSDRRPE